MNFTHDIIRANLNGHKFGGWHTLEAEEYFDKLWQRAIPVTEDDVTGKRLIDLLEKVTLIKEITL